jgi:hypothetical protein
MKRDELRKYIETILLDIRGDRIYPDHMVLRANASLIMSKMDEYIESQNTKKGKTL